MFSSIQDDFVSFVIGYTDEPGKRNGVSDFEPYLVGYDAHDLALLIIVWRHRS